ncbi:MAG: cyclic nucleotide-binding domain-containing protein, partial [Candidatus Omnitrophica bacterium]|nr:cyclic nucleotide-binding domain-containing protein [Candidatus Omnitrophota bacterium]
MDIDRQAIIRQIPLFSGLTDAQRRIIFDKSAIVFYRKDEIIYKEGDGPSAFYCIIAGRVLLSAKDKSGNENILEYLHRGKYFGIISLLTGEPHSVTAVAINDSMILRIEAEDFKAVLAKAPQLSIDLMQTLSRRLKRKDLHEKTIFESTVISVFSSHTQSGKTIYAINLALSLEKETRKKILLVDIASKGKSHRIPQKLGAKGQVGELDLDYFDLSAVESFKDFILKDAYGIDIVCVSYESSNADNVKKIISALSMLVNDYHYIILDLPVAMDETMLGILNQSDVIELVSSPDEVGLKKTNRLIERLKREYNFNPEKIKIIVNEYKQTKLRYEDKV